MAFSTEVAEQALLACARYCCLCHKFCGNKIETHHIVQGGGDDFDNCIPLCFDCHAEVPAYNSQHPKGRKFSHSEVKGHRDRWYQMVKDGKYLLAGGFLSGDKVMVKYDLRHFGSDPIPILAVEVINTGASPLYIKEVSLGWQFQDEEEGRFSYSVLNAKEDWQTPLQPGMNRDYTGSIEPIVFSRGSDSRRYDDVWIRVATPKGEIQKVVGLGLMFSTKILSRAFVSSNSRMHIVGKYLYPI